MLGPTEVSVHGSARKHVLCERTSDGGRRNHGRLVPVHTEDEVLEAIASIVG